MTAKRYLTAGAATALGLFICWALLAIMETLSRPPVVSDPASAEVYIAGPEDDFRAMLPGDGIATTITQFPGGGALVGDDERVQQGSIMVHRFTLTDADLTTQLAAHMTFSRAIVSVRLNGTRLYTGSFTRSWAANAGYNTDAYTLPPELLQAGENTLILSSKQVSRMAYPIITIDEAGPILRSVWWSQFSAGTAVAIAAALLTFVAILFLSVDWPRRDRLMAGGVIVLCLTWIFYNLNALGWPVVPPPWHSVLGYVAVYAVVAGFVFCTAARLSAPRWCLLGLAAMTTAIMLVPVAAGFSGSQAVFAWAWPIEVWSKMILAPLMLAAFAWNHARSETTSVVETAAFSACLFAMFLDGVDDRFSTTVPFLAHLPLGSYAVPWFGSVFALGMAAALATQAARARRIAVDHGDILLSRLNEQEVKLEASFLREKALTRQETLMDERQRLMRDMHDGIGGQLVSLIVQSRSGHVQGPEISRSLTAILEDLRLIVDSLDTAGDSLGFAIGGFRDRIGPKLREAEIELVWQIDPDAAARPIGPELTLQILRILQEACSNAIQHAQARTLTIALRPDPVASDRGFILSVADDGIGLEGDASAHKGTRTMAVRARQIGADLDVRSEAGIGACVELRVVPRTAA